MGTLYHLHSCAMVDDFHATIVEPKIQTSWICRQQSQVYPVGPFTSIYHFFRMAFSSSHLHQLYSSIFAPQKQTSMTFNIAINVMPLKELLDPQGKAVMTGLHNLGIDNATDVRIGKRITIQIEAASEEAAIETAKEAAAKLLANPVMEHFEISVI